jgi:hypothetical protein
LETDRNVSIEGRVGKVEVALETLHEDVTSMKGDIRSIALSVNTGFDQLRREQMAGRQTNWGWVAAFIGVGVAIAGGVMTALVRPLDKFDEFADKRITGLEELVNSSWEQSIRNDERWKLTEKKVP